LSLDIDFHQRKIVTFNKSKDSYNLSYVFIWMGERRPRRLTIWVGFDIESKSEVENIQFLHTISHIGETILIQFGDISLLSLINPFLPPPRGMRSCQKCASSHVPWASFGSAAADLRSIGPSGPCKGPLKKTDDYGGDMR